MQWNYAVGLGLIIVPCETSVDFFFCIKIIQPCEYGGLSIYPVLVFSCLLYPCLCGKVMFKCEYLNIDKETSKLIHHINIHVIYYIDHTNPGC